MDSNGWTQQRATNPTTSLLRFKKSKHTALPSSPSVLLGLWLSLRNLWGLSFGANGNLLQWTPPALQADRWSTEKPMQSERRHHHKRPKGDEKHYSDTMFGNFIAVRSAVLLLGFSCFWFRGRSRTLQLYHAEGYILIVLSINNILLIIYHVGSSDVYVTCNQGATAVMLNLLC